MNSLDVDDVTVSSQIVRLLIAFAAVRGVEPATVLAAHGVEESALAELDSRLPARVVLSLWAGLREQTALPHFGVALAEFALSVPMATLGGHLVQSARTLGDGLARLVAFERVLHGVQATSLDLAGATAVVEHSPPIGVGPGAIPAIEFAFAWVTGIARRTTGTEVVPESVSFRHDAPANLEVYRSFFGVVPRFGAAADKLELSHAALALPQVTADEIVRDLVERHARSLLERLPAGPETAARVRARLGERIALGLSPDPGLPAIAAELRIPARTLQRRLATEGATYQGLLDEVRFTLAREHLEDPATSIAEVAFALGFQDQSAFHRAFVRWAGETPGEHRRRLLER